MNMYNSKMKRILNYEHDWKEFVSGVLTAFLFSFLLIFREEFENILTITLPFIILFFQGALSALYKNSKARFAKLNFFKSSFLVLFIAILFTLIFMTCWLLFVDMIETRSLAYNILYFASGLIKIVYREMIVPYILGYVLFKLVTILKRKSTML